MMSIDNTYSEEECARLMRALQKLSANSRHMCRAEDRWNVVSLRYEEAASSGRHARRGIGDDVTANARTSIGPPRLHQSKKQPFPKS